MSPEDDPQSLPRLASVPPLGVMTDKNTWNKQHSQKNGVERMPESNGHAKNGSTNGYPNGTSENINGGDVKKDLTYAWTPLLDIPLKDETLLYGTSNNNDWKEAEEINNLRNNMHKTHGNNNGSLMNGKNGIGIDKISEEDPLTGVGKQQINDDGPSCGLFGCRPKWARSLASTHMFMVVFLLAWILQGMYLTYFVSVITTIEKLFQIKSKTTGMLLSATEIGQICTAMLLTYFAGRGHRPRWIAVGMVIFSIAAFGCSLPHFIFGRQLLQSNELSLSGRTAMLQRLSLNDNLNNLTTDFNHDDLNLCLFTNGTGGKFGDVSECEEALKLEQASHSKITFIVLCIFFVSFLSAGVGQTAVSTLGIPYIDDNVASRESPVYLAITIGVRILGPATGFIVGSFCTRIYVDLSTPGIDPTDPKWISAWWLGPVMIGTLMMLASIAMFSFPKQLRGTRIPPPLKIRTVEQNKIQPVKEAKPKLKDFPKTVRRQLSNDILMFRTASSVFHILPIAGLYTFLPKYLETQFRLPAADAALITAFGGILVMGVGIIISGIVILKVNPTARWVAGWIAFTALIYSCGMAILMFVGCNMDDFAGLNKYSTTSASKFEPIQNLTCHCDFNKFSPVCGVDGMTYFSPCHAGCSSSKSIDGKRVFLQCESIPDFSEQKQSFEATSGYCEGKCNSFVLFICLFAFCVFMHSTSEVGSMLLIMRCTDPKDKAMAMGVIQSAIGLFGNVPCPIIYGAVIDSACIVWKTVCGRPGACSLYDIEGFRHYFLGITAGIMFIAFIMDLIVWHKSHRIDIAPPDPKPNPTDTDNEKSSEPTV